MNNRNKILALGSALLLAAKTYAADPTTVEGVVTAASALPGSSTTIYISGAVLGLGIFTVGLAFYVIKRGVKTR